MIMPIFTIDHDESRIGAFIGKNLSRCKLDNNHLVEALNGIHNLTEEQYSDALGVMERAGNGNRFDHNELNRLLSQGVRLDKALNTVYAK